MGLKNSFAVVSIACTLLLAGCAPATIYPTPSATAPAGSDPQARAALPESIRIAGKLVIAVDTTYAPNEFKDIGGRPAGWEIELLRAAGVKLGLTVVYDQVDFATIIPGVKSGTFNVGLASIFDTSQRRQEVQMVDYYNAGILWAQQKGTSVVNPDDACGLSVAAQSDTFEAIEDLPKRSAKCVAEGKKPIEIVTYVNQSDATEALQLGRVDALIADSPVTLYSVQQSNGKLISVGSVYGITSYGLPVQKGSKLGRALQLALQSLIDDGKYHRILSSWGVQQGAVAKVTLNEAGQ